MAFLTPCCVSWELDSKAKNMNQCRCDRGANTDGEFGAKRPWLDDDQQHDKSHESRPDGRQPSCSLKIPESPARHTGSVSKCPNENRRNQVSEDGQVCCGWFHWDFLGGCQLRLYRGNRKRMLISHRSVCGFVRLFLSEAG